MKYTKVFFLSTLFLFFSVKSASAVTYLANPNIKIVTVAPTATPTPKIVKINPNINVNLIVTGVPTKMPTTTPVVVTQVVTATATVTPTPSEEIASPTAKIETVQNKDTSKIFTWVTLGFLVVILTIQLWPRKKKEN